MRILLGNTALDSRFHIKDPLVISGINSGINLQTEDNLNLSKLFDTLMILVLKEIFGKS